MSDPGPRDSDPRDPGPRDPDPRDPDDREGSPSDAERIRKELDAFRACFERQRLQSIAPFDQFIAYLHDLEHLVDRVADLELPPGHRIQLVRATNKLLRSAILHLRREWDTPEDPGDVYEQALAIVEDTHAFTLEHRLETRASHQAAELAGDDDYEAFDWVAHNYDLLQELVDEAGWNPPDERIRAWLRRHAPRYPG